MSSSAALFSQLKSFLSTHEQDAKKLRAAAEQRPTKGPTVAAAAQDNRSGLEYLADLQRDVASADRTLENIFSDVCGSPENRLAFVTMEEMLAKCRALYEANENSISQLELHLTKFGYKGDTKRAMRKQLTESEDKENIPINHGNSDDDWAEALQGLTMNDGSIAVDCATEFLVESEKTEAVVVDATYVEGKPSSPNMDRDQMKQTQEYYDDCESENGGTSSIFARDGPKTPTMNWKLSKSTRSILQSIPYNAPEVTSTGNADLSHDREGAKEEQYSYCCDVATPESPEEIDLTHMSMHRSFDASKAISTPGQRNINQSSMITPEASTRKMKTAIYSNQSTPPTPTFGTPFLTCRPREVEEARLVRTLESKPAVESTEMISSVASGKKSKQNTPSASQATCSSEYDSDKSMDDVPQVLVCSPPKAKVLQSRKTAVGAEGWIPHITTEDMATAPLSLKLQITLEVLNNGIDCLNRFIAEHTSKQNTRLETFTLEEMTQIVVGSLGKVTINVFALSLVQLKRLDLGMENSIRVYKVATEIAPSTKDRAGAQFEMKFRIFNLGSDISSRKVKLLGHTSSSWVQNHVYFN